MSSDATPSADAGETLDAQLAGLAERITLLERDPTSLAAPGGRVYGAILRLFLPDLVFETDALVKLARLIAVWAKAASTRNITPHLAATAAELGRNVAIAEKYARAGVPLGLARTDALRVTYELLERASRIEPASDAARIRADYRAMLASCRGAIADTTLDDDHDARRHQIELNVVDELIDLALDEFARPARRRELLEGARVALTDVSAAAGAPAASIAKRRSTIGREIVRLDRAEAAGLSTTISVLHQARQAHARHDPDALRTALWWMDGCANARDDKSLGRRTDMALRAMFEGLDPRTARARAACARRSARESFGDRGLAALEASHARAVFEQTKGRLAPTRPTGGALDPQLIEMFSAMSAADGAFEVGGSLAPVRVVESTITHRVVRHPTQTLRLEHAETVDDIPVAIVEDPRTILHDLATGRLLARRFVAKRVETKESTVLRGEARFYLLDGSSSMLNPPVEARARVRDAIILAELTSALRRFEVHGPRTRVALRFRYFTDELFPPTDVRAADDAVRGIDTVFRTKHRGGTDIETALLRCFADIRQAVEDDPELAEAQIVLVTDGEAPVDATRVADAQRAVGELPVRVSVIALGQQNDALRAIVVRQRAEGGSTFYQHFGDPELEAMLRVDPTEAALHPAEADPTTPSDATTAARWHETTKVLLEEIAALERSRESDRLIEARADRDAYARAAQEIDFMPGPSLSGVLAADESDMRDARALEARFDRWFPATSAAGGTPYAPRGRTDIESEIVLLSIAELLAFLGGDPLRKKADAIELLERMLPAADLDVFRYARAIRAPSGALIEAIHAVRGAVSATK